MADVRARARRIRDALTPSEWGRAGGMAATVIALNVLAGALLAAALRRPLPHHQDRDLRRGHRHPGLHPRHAARLRRRPHRGHRQHHPQARQRGQAAAVRRLLLLARALLRRVRARAAAELRHPRRGQPGARRAAPPCTASPGSSAPWSRERSCSSSPRSTWPSWSRSRRFSARCGSAATATRNWRSSWPSAGLMNRFLGPLARRVDTPWKMYPVGVLFGLGFDTATEVALLVLAGSAVVSGLPFYAVLSLPLLFAAGMSLFDTADGCFMNFAYDWAFARPVRKVYYNLTITGLSVFVAFFVGAVEILGLHRPGDPPQRRVLGVHAGLQHQQGRVRHRRACSCSPGWSPWPSGTSAGSSRNGKPPPRARASKPAARGSGGREAIRPDAESRCARLDFVVQS